MLLFKLLVSINFCLLLTFIFIPINLNSSSIVKISFTKGKFVSLTLLANIQPARIGRVAFFDPEIFIEPDRDFLPLIKSFCIKELNLRKSNAFLFHIFSFSFCICNTWFFITFYKNKLCYTFISINLRR